MLGLERLTIDVDSHYMRSTIALQNIRHIFRDRIVLERIDFTNKGYHFTWWIYGNKKEIDVARQMYDDWRRYELDQCRTEHETQTIWSTKHGRQIVKEVYLIA